MTLSIGPLELLVLSLFAVVTLVMYLRSNASFRWFLAALVCITLASLLSPADIVSMAVLCFALLTTFAMGTRYRIHRWSGVP